MVDNSVTAIVTGYVSSAFDFPTWSEIVYRIRSMTALDVLGWVGSCLFSLCGAPQAWSSWKKKHSDGLTWAFLLMWLGGEIATLIYVSTKTDVLPLLVNYWLNLALLLVIIWFRAFPKREKTLLLG